MLPIVILWIHLLAAMTWIGGMLFVWLVLRPSLRKPVLDPQAQAVLSRVEGRFRTIRWYSLLTLLGTGLFNLVHEGSSARLESSWGGVLMIKLFFVAAVMGITGINDFLISPTKTSTGSANRTKDSLTGIIFLLALLIVFIGVYLREM
jgi:putative copper resistance protein D